MVIGLLMYCILFFFINIFFVFVYNFFIVDFGIVLYCFSCLICFLSERMDGCVCGCDDDSDG